MRVYGYGPDLVDKSDRLSLFDRRKTVGPGHWRRRGFCGASDCAVWISCYGWMFAKLFITKAVPELDSDACAGGGYSFDAAIFEESERVWPFCECILDRCVLPVSQRNV